MNLSNLIIISLLCTSSLFANPSTTDAYTPKAWERVGFPQDIDRRAVVTEEQGRALFRFFDGMVLAIKNRHNDDEIAIYAEIMKGCLTPMEGDEPRWTAVIADYRLSAFAGTRYAQELIPLLRPILLSYPHDSVRAVVGLTMARLGDKSSVIDILPLLDSKSENVRIVAWKTLQMMDCDMSPLPAVKQ